ncbi:uncharacterized protein HD556DRAFT_442820 [Suillus plorans]|uniref:Uncharacterized protein n=1 Tax=Suillus plorans TaxID=116603 RepID=A0A9P7DH71_9AGAM|nr:uncharacterized protein HD556DRAFT_442820 [Suillus plorans]KAG1794173.1 hypothetical protein HD556DRAFT_442820 [Suillus plorans]
MSPKASNRKLRKSASMNDKAILLFENSPADNYQHGAKLPAKKYTSKNLGIMPMKEEKEAGTTQPQQDDLKVYFYYFYRKIMYTYLLRQTKESGMESGKSSSPDNSGMTQCVPWLAMRRGKERARRLVAASVLESWESMTMHQIDNDIMFLRCDAQTIVSLKIIEYYKFSLVSNVKMSETERRYQ